MPRLNFATIMGTLIAVAGMTLCYHIGAYTHRPSTAEELDDIIAIIGYDVDHSTLFMRMSLIASSIERNGPTNDSIGDMITCLGLLGNIEGIRSVLKYGETSGVANSDVRNSARGWIEHIKKSGARAPGEPPKL